MLETVTQELTEVLQLNQAGEKNVTTRKGRNYTVSSEKKPGLFVCDHCSPIQFYPSNIWYQISYKETALRLHNSLVHIFQVHPMAVTPSSLEKAASVFLRRA